MWRLRNIKESVENKILKYDPVEVAVREATSDEPWGPTGKMYSDLTSLSFEYESYGLLMKSLWERIQNPYATWRNIYKSLLVLDYLIKFGSERVATNIQANSYILQCLKHKKYVDDSDQDQTKNIIHRASEILNLVNDPVKLEAERLKAHDYKKRMSSTTQVESEYAKNVTRMAKIESEENPATKILTNVRNTISKIISKDDDFADARDVNFIGNTHVNNKNESYTQRNSESYSRKTDGSSKVVNSQPFDPFQASPKNEEKIITENTINKNKSEEQQIINLLDFSDPPLQKNNDLNEIFDPFSKSTTQVNTQMQPIQVEKQKVSNISLIDNMLFTQQNNQQYYPQKSQQNYYNMPQNNLTYNNNNNMMTNIQNEALNNRNIYQNNNQAYKTNNPMMPPSSNMNANDDNFDLFKSYKNNNSSSVPGDKSMNKNYKNPDPNNNLFF